MAEFQHSLRPTFTANIAQLLQRGKSVNLIGADGTGRERLLEDIRAALPETAVILVNLKNYRRSYDSLLEEIWRQLGKNGEKPANLTAMIEQCERQNRQTFLCLHNFDALLDTTENDAKYDTAFYDALNFCRNRPNIALLCVTQNPHDQSLVSINGKLIRNSWLDLEQKRIPALTRLEILAELERAITPEMRYLRHENLLGELIERIQASPKPHSFLVFVADKFTNREDADLPLKKRLKRWEQAFATMNPTLTPANISHVQEKISFYRHLFGFAPGQTASRWKLFVKIALGVAGLLGVIGAIKPESLKKILDVLNSWMP